MDTQETSEDQIREGIQKYSSDIREGITTEEIEDKIQHARKLQIDILHSSMIEFDKLQKQILELKCLNSEKTK